MTLCNKACLKSSPQPQIQNMFIMLSTTVFIHLPRQTCRQTDVQKRQTDVYRQSEHMCKSGIMLIFYFSQRGLLAWQKGNKNYSIKQLSFHIQIWLQPHKARRIILLSNPPMEYSYWKYPEREIILRSFLSLVYFLLQKKKITPAFRFYLETIITSGLRMET